MDTAIHPAPQRHAEFTQTCFPPPNGIDLDNDDLPAAPALSPPLRKTRKVNFKADGGIEEVNDDCMEEDLEAPSSTAPSPTNGPGQSLANLGTLDPAVVQLLAGMRRKTENTLVGKMDQTQASQQTVLETVNAQRAQIASIEARLQVIETKQSQQAPQDVPSYVSQLQHEVKELTQPDASALTCPCPVGTPAHTSRSCPS